MCQNSSCLLELSHWYCLYSITFWLTQQPPLKSNNNTCFLINVWSSAIWASIFGEVKWTKKTRPVENPPWNTIISIDLAVQSSPIPGKSSLRTLQSPLPHHKNHRVTRTSRISHSKQKVLWGKPTQCRFLFLQISNRQSRGNGCNLKKKNGSTLRIMGSENWWFGDPRTLLYRVKPLLFGGSNDS